jgi:hypothetical protein
MTINRTALRAIIAIYFAALAVIYAIAWISPAIGVYHDDAIYLVLAKAIAAGHGYLIESLPEPVPETGFPPLFPALLALFTLVSQQVQWLKLLPLACTAGWLILTRKLLLKMGASANSALLLVGMTAASPAIVLLSTNLMAESLFALLVTAALLTLLEERVWLSGLFAGLATLTRIAGVPLIVACILILVARRRLRSAAIFAAVATVMIAPWFGWSLAHAGNTYLTSNILTGLAASEKLMVLGHNFVGLLASPFALITGYSNTFSIGITAVILIGSLIARRQLAPDLFVALYCAALLCWIWPPERFVAPILPLILWIVWRALRKMEHREALAAIVIIAALVPLFANATRKSGARDQAEMQKLFASIRANTSPQSVLLANQDAAFYLNTGRKAIRGFVPGGFDLYYAVRQSAITPDKLSNAIRQSHVSYVVLTPDAGFAESPAFHESVAALERGGVVEPLDLPGQSRDYRLLKVNHR